MAGKRKQDGGVEPLIDGIVNDLIYQHVVKPDVEDRLEIVMQRFKQKLGNNRCMLARYMFVLKQNYQVEVALKRARQFTHLDMSNFFNQNSIRKREATLYHDFFQDLVYLSKPEEVSFTTRNQAALGELSERDYFTFCFWQMLTVSRSSEDQQLSLCISGKSTVGKSQLCRPLAHHFRSVCNQKGVGTLAADSGTTGLLFQDVQIKDLLDPQVFHAIKLISRNECYYAKTFATSTKNPPLWICVETNCRLQRHQLPNGTVYHRDWQIPKGNRKGSSINTMTDHAKFVEPLTQRFLEMHFFERPYVRDKDVFHAKLNAKDCAIGLFPLVLGLLEQLDSKTDFGGGTVFKSHILYGLIQTAPAYLEIMTCDVTSDQERIETKLHLFAQLDTLREKFDLVGIVPTATSFGVVPLPVPASFFI